ncbi:FAD-dependent oxidoreductase [Arthrobacter sp. Br18]|uniref:dihydrolipoyl dehydrogenase family protein n=1 Tax=Arthrobacter sp. Br18 TaxID=1312954 RepID=UPI0004B6EA4D|nr:FAD-dependent oxidoreductase [Arthrobacter sp. Br18]
MERVEGVVDLLVIGGGTAGIVGARTAARLGARTVLVERARTGGDCLWTGCIPSKTLISAARRSATRQALTGNGTNFVDVRQRISEAISTIEPDDSPATLESYGVSVLFGTARFTGPGEAEVDGRTIRFRQALIATGSAPLMPPLPGLETALVVTSESVWDLETLPGRLVIIGGGPIGCELGQAFARLGSQVVILSRSEILPREDREAAAVVRKSLISDGVEVLEGTKADRVTGNRAGDSAVITSDGREVPADVILVAAGRKARTADLGLDRAGVERDDAGYVVVDSGMRSSNPAIWAAGDVTPYPDYTHAAGMYASTAASNAVLGLRRGVSGIIPRVTFTSPEVAAVGVTSSSAEGHSTSTIHYADTDRAITEEQTDGFVKIVVGRRGRILGGTIVGPRAGETLGELALAVQQKLTTRDLAGVMHAYPTYNDALWNAAITHAGSTLDVPLVRFAVKLLAGINRWRSARASNGRSTGASNHRSSRASNHRSTRASNGRSGR